MLTVVFRTPRNLLYEKTAESIKYRQENAVTSCFASKTGSEAILNFHLEAPFLRIRCKSMNYRQDSNGTSCLASKKGSDTILGCTIIVFSTPRNPENSMRTLLDGWYLLYAVSFESGRHPKWYDTLLVYLLL